jgi:hypothetical protein
MQVALAATLLIGAGLLLRSFERMLDESPGFQPRDLLAVQFELSGSRYRDPDARRAFMDAVLERIAAEPGVASRASVVGRLTAH